MALALDAAHVFAGDGSGVSSMTWSHVVSGSDRLLLVGVYQTAGDTTTISSVTYNGVAMTEVLREVEATLKVTCAIYRLIAPDTGTHDVVVTFSGTVSDCGGGSCSYTGVHQTTPLGTAVKASALSGGPATVDASSAAGEIVFGALGTISIDVAVGTGVNDRWEYEVDGSAGHISAGGDKTGAASVTMSWTLTTGTSWAIGAVPIKPSTERRWILGSH